jgi:L-fuculose-phosphate aldolase
MNEIQARVELSEVCRLAYQRGYISGKEGNFSIRLENNRVLSTPRGICKGRVNPEDFILCDTDGNELDVPAAKNGNGSRVSTEFPMHRIAYKVRPDISAVVHAHPITAVGFTVAGISLNKCVLPEVVCTLGNIPTAPYATPSTEEIPNSIEKLIAQHDAILLDHHGALTVGSGIWDAFYKLETMEHYAQTLLVAHMLGGAQPLYSSQVKKLLQIRSIYGSTSALDENELIGPNCAQPDPETVA